ncbi:MAG: hydrogenase-4 component E, partial [Desulfovibrionaceae bacterium]
VAENGIFLLGLPMMLGGSVWFELSILLDVFVAVFVMGIAINHINATFESIDVGRFCSLRD